MREGDEIPRINPLFSLTILYLYAVSSVAAANAFCRGHPTRMLMGAASITRAIMKRLIESFLHKEWTNISVVKLSSTEAGVMKCCEDKWNDAAIGLHGLHGARMREKRLRKYMQALESSYRGCDKRCQDASLCLSCS